MPANPKRTHPVLRNTFLQYSYLKDPVIANLILRSYFGKSCFAEFNLNNSHVESLSSENSIAMEIEILKIQCCKNPLILVLQILLLQILILKNLCLQVLKRHILFCEIFFCKIFIFQILLLHMLILSSYFCKSYCCRFQYK